MASPGSSFELASIASGAPTAGGPMIAATRLLTIDGNRAGQAVLFNHDAHLEREGGTESCATCHHLDLPLDSSSSCYECHRDMYESTSLFDHPTHVTALGGNTGCTECHDAGNPTKGRESATACAECHAAPAGSSSVIPAPQPHWRDAPGYMDAMHGLCITCHTLRAAQEPERFGDLLDRCDACHDADTELLLRNLAPARSSNYRDLHASRGGSRD